MERADDSTCGYKKESRECTFDQAGLPFDFGDPNASSSRSSTSSETGSSSNTSETILEPNPECTLFPVPRTRGRLDGRLCVPQRELRHIWKAQNYHLVTSKSLQPCGMAPSLHKFTVMERGNKLPITDGRINDGPQAKVKVKLRGRLDGRLYSPALQTRFLSSMSRSGRSSGNLGVPMTPSSRKHADMDEMSNSEMGCCCTEGSKSYTPNSDSQSPSEPNENPLRRNRTSVPSPVQEQYRGRIDARLYRPQGMESTQMHYLTTSSGDSMQNSPEQDLTYNDSLALEARLLPECTNRYQTKKEVLFEYLQLRGRIDGRVFSPQKDGMWGANQAPPGSSNTPMSEDEMMFNKVAPSFIQDLYQKACPGQVESDEIDQGTETNEFPSSFDPEFVQETNEPNLDVVASAAADSQQIEGGNESVRTPNEETLEKPKPAPMEASTSSKQSIEDKGDVDLEPYSATLNPVEPGLSQ